MSCGGGHRGFPIGIKHIHFIEDFPMIIPGQFGFNCPSGFREEAFWNIFPIGSNVKLSPAVAAILNFISEQKNVKFVEDHPMNIHVQFGFNRICSFWEEGIWTFSHRVQCKSMYCGGGHLGFPIDIKKHKFCRGPSNDHSWAVWFQLSKWFQRRSVLKHFPNRVQC
jgi:hypothetical protein